MNNPYYYWWKVRKFWKRPKLHLAHIGGVTWWYGLPCRKDAYNKYISIHMSGLGWKDKYGSACFEWDPYLCLTFFRTFQIIFTWDFCPHFMRNDIMCNHATASELTWEAIIEMVYFNKSISDACHDVGFAEPYDPCEDSDYYIPSRIITVFRNLTKRGWKEYYKIPRSKMLKSKK